MSTLPARLLILLLCALPYSVEAVTLVVDTTDDDPALTACDDATPDDCSLRGAILAADERPMAEASTVNVPAGRYVLTQSATCIRRFSDGGVQTFPSISLCLSGQVTIQGAGADATIIDGNAQHTVLYVSFGADAEVRAATLTNGFGDSHGGGVRNQGTLRLTDAVVSHSRPGMGGGLTGAGIYNAGSLTLLRSTVTNNVAPGNDQGGGIYNDGFAGAVLTVIDSLISNNTIGASGGGIDNDPGGVVTISGSTVAGNTAVKSVGGGIINFGTLTMTNSTISGNQSGSSGGGLSNWQNGSTTLSNVTLTKNISGMAGSGQGGGIDNALGHSLVLRNTIVAGNTDLAGTPPKPDCDARTGFSSALTSQGYNLIGSTAGCDITGDLTGNITGVDPQLGVLADNGGFTLTHGLGDGSPAIDAGNPAAPGSGGAACAASDQRGVLRPLGTTCDIGAFERSSAFSLTKILPNSGGNDGSVMALLSGGGFAPGTTVALRRAGHADIAGRPVATESAGAALTTSFDLSGAATGSWDVVVTNPDLESATLPGGFTVETPRAADLFAIVVARSGARPGLPARFEVLYGNRGNTDALGVPLTLGLPASFARRFSMAVDAPPAQPGQPFDDYRDVPIEVTADVASEQADIPLLIPIVPAGFTGLLAFTLTPPGGTAGTEFRVEAFMGTPWFANGAVRPEVVAQAAARARQFAADRLGLTAGPELDPALIGYETAALELAVTTSRDELVGNVGQSRRVFSVAYLAIDLAGFAAAQTMASVAPAPLTWFAGLPRRLASSFGVVASAVEAQAICPPCVCDVIVQEGCSTCSEKDCIKPIDPDKRPKKPPNGLTPAECGDLPGHIVSADGKTCKPDGSRDCPQLLGSPFSTDPFCRTYPIKNSYDPNDKAGSGGSGPERFVPTDTPMPYAIAFENLPAATAPAQIVVVTDQLDTQVLDLDSFTLGPILIGSIGITPPPGLATFSGGADLRPAHNVVVRVDAALDKATGIATWRFTSLDPATMETLTDPDEGFFPPNTNPPAGDGQVHFTILPKAGLATGAEIRNRARVVFDTNAPIDTPEWLNTVDASAPASQVLPLASTQPSASFLLEWAGTDDGAGILDYSIFVSVDGGPFTAFLTGTTDTSAAFNGELGKTYAFYSITRDLVGNVEAAPAVADARTALTGTPPEACIGDCDGNGTVAINELVLGVKIVLGSQSVSACPAFVNSQGAVNVAQLIRGVNNALGGCGD
jgi:hypothetical protein